MSEEKRKSIKETKDSPEGNNPRRKSLKESLANLASGLFKKDQKSKEPEMEISAPTGFTRNVHVGLVNGEVEGMDKIMEALEQLKTVESASWDKIQKLKKITHKSGEEVATSPGTDSTVSTESVQVKSPEEEKVDGGKETTPKEVVAPVLEKSVEPERVLTKILCQYDSEDARAMRNAQVLQGTPLKSSLSLIDAKKKGFVISLEHESIDDVDDHEIQLCYYTTTKAFLIEPLYKKQPIHKEYFVISLEELVGAKKEGLKSLAVQFQGKTFLEIDVPVACVILRDSFIAMRKK